MVKASRGNRVALILLVASLLLLALPGVSFAAVVGGYPGPTSGPTIPPGPSIGPLGPGQSASTYACGFKPGSEVAVKAGTTLAQTLIADVNGCVLLVINVFAGPTMTISGGKTVQVKPDSNGVVWVYCTGVNNKGDAVGIKFPITVPLSNLQGFVVFQGMPRGYIASVTVMACPTTSTLTDNCVGGRQTVANSGRFAMSVPVTGSQTTYRLTAGALTAGGLPVQASPAQVVVKAVGVTTKNISFPYVAPTVAGTVKIAKAPQDFNGALGVQICPQTVAMAYGCAGGSYVSGAAVAKTKSAFGASLLPGRWALAAGYRSTVGATPLLGAASKVNVVGSSSQTLNLSVNYSNPTMSGTVTTTGIAGLTPLVILACPSTVAFGLGCAGGQQASTVASDGSFAMWATAKTTYDVAAGYPMTSGGTFFAPTVRVKVPTTGSADGVALSLDKKTSPFTFTVKVNGVPNGVNVGVGVLACPVGYTKFTTSCLSSYVNPNFGSSGDGLAISLPQGDWDVAGGYVQLQGGQIVSNPRWGTSITVTASGTRNQAVDLPVDFFNPSISGTAVVSNLAAGSGASIFALACPGPKATVGCAGGSTVPVSGGKFSFNGLKGGSWSVAPMVQLGGSTELGGATVAIVTLGRTSNITLRAFTYTRPSVAGRVY